MRQINITRNIHQHEKTLERYFVEINKYPLLSSEEEVALAIKIKEGDIEARNKLVNSNLRFVVSVAKKFQGNKIALKDLINDGNAGMIKASEKFDHTRGFKFISYAVSYIQQQIHIAIFDQKEIIRPSAEKTSIHSRMDKFAEKFLQEEEREPNEDEMAEKLELKNKKVKDVNLAKATHISLDYYDDISDGENYRSLHELIRDVDSEIEMGRCIEESDLEACLEGIMSRLLIEKEKYIIKSFFGIGLPYPKSVETLAEEFSTSDQTVMNYKNSGLKKLRANPRATKMLAQFLR